MRIAPLLYRVLLPGCTIVMDPKTMTVISHVEVQEKSIVRQTRLYRKLQKKQADQREDVIIGP